MSDALGRGVLPATVRVGGEKVTVMMAHPVRERCRSERAMSRHGLAYECRRPLGFAKAASYARAVTTHTEAPTRIPTPSS